MKKRVWLTVLLCVALALASLSLVACGGKGRDNGNGSDAYTQGLEYTLDDGGASYTVTGLGTATENDVIIPATYQGLPVVSIGDEAFSSYQNLTSVTIPQGVTTIGDYAFRGCRSLTSVMLPQGVTTIGDYAFYQCMSLTNITIPQQVTAIGGMAFDYCQNLTSITIPQGVTSIGRQAFERCSSLTIYCEAEAKPSEWDSSWNPLPAPVVWNCKNNDKDENGYAYAVIDGVRYSLKDGIATVETHPTNISGSITVLSNVTYKSDSYSVTGIESWAFSGCSSLSEITIPNSVTSIGNSAFERCISLTIYCEAGSRPTNWDGSWNPSACPVVWNCKNNDKDESGYAYTVIDGMRYSLKDGIATMAVQPSNLSGSVTIPSSVTYKSGSYSVTSIGDSAFYRCSSLKGITIGSSVTRIGDSAFYYCSSLTSITIGSGVTTIGTNAFYDCSSLTSITIGSNVTTIGNELFYFCAGLTIYCEAESAPSGFANRWNSSRPVVWNCKNNNKDKDGYEYAIIDGVRYGLKDGIATVETQPRNLSGAITIPASVTYKSGSYSVTSIGFFAFSSCSSLTGITIGSSVTSIGHSAFMDCNRLTSITIPQGVTSIEGSAFSECYRLRSITVDGNNQNYCSQDGILYNKAKTEIVYVPLAIIGAVTIPQGITSIEDLAFSRCSSLTSITVDSNNQNYSSQDGILYNKAKTELICVPSAISGAITIPQGVTSIENYAFSNRNGLTSITFAANSQLTSIGWSAFQGCSNLTDITIPQSVTSIESSAFSGCSGLTGIYITDIAAWCNIVFYGGDSANPLYYAQNLYVNGTLLTDLVIPNGVTSIGSYAFYNCSSLTSITIPNSVTSIGWNAFSDCSSLTSVTFENTNGWKADSTDVDVTNPTQNATYLTSTYCNNTWTRN